MIGGAAKSHERFVASSVPLVGATTSRKSETPNASTTAAAQPARLDPATVDRRAEEQREQQRRRENRLDEHEGAGPERDGFEHVAADVGAHTDQPPRTVRELARCSPSLSVLSSAICSASCCWRTLLNAYESAATTAQVTATANRPTVMSTAIRLRQLVASLSRRTDPSARRQAYAGFAGVRRPSRRGCSARWWCRARPRCPRSRRGC